MFTYCDLKVHHLVRKCRHLIVEAKSVFADLLGSENEITLTLFLPVQNDILDRPDDLVVDIE